MASAQRGPHGERGAEAGGKVEIILQQEQPVGGGVLRGGAGEQRPVGRHDALRPRGSAPLPAASPASRCTRGGPPQSVRAQRASVAARTSARSARESIRGSMWISLTTPSEAQG